MEKQRQLYEYEGPVYYCGKLVANNWKAKTQAVSEKQAKSFIECQYKRKEKYALNADIKIASYPTLAVI